MSKPETITIDEVKYVRADSVEETKNFSKDKRVMNRYQRRVLEEAKRFNEFTLK